VLFDLFKAFDKFESGHKSDIFIRKDLFSFMRAQHVMSYHLIKLPCVYQAIIEKGFYMNK